MRVEKAFPAIVSKTKFRRVNSLMRSRAPKIAHPRRVASSYLLSGLVKCKACNRALSGQDAKSGQFSYYVCQSIMKRGKDACKTPRLNARRFEEMVVGKVRSNVLTDGNIRALVKVVDEHGNGHSDEAPEPQQSLFSWAEFIAEEPVKPKGRGRKAQPATASLFDWALTLEQEKELVGAGR